jgi:hypothetical protein
VALRRCIAFFFSPPRACVSLNEAIRFSAGFAAPVGRLAHGIGPHGPKRVPKTRRYWPSARDGALPRLGSGTAEVPTAGRLLRRKFGSLAIAIPQHPAEPFAAADFAPGSTELFAGFACRNGPRSTTSAGEPTAAGSTSFPWRRDYQFARHPRASVLWWMPASGHPLASDHDRDDVVELQGCNCDATTCRTPYDTGRVFAPVKVSAPSLAARIE